MADPSTHTAESTHVATPSAPVSQPVKAIRRLMEQGNSHTIAVPGIFRRALSLFAGDDVELILDREWGGFFVRPVTPRVVRPTVPDPAPAKADGI